MIICTCRITLLDSADVLIYKYGDVLKYPILARFLSMKCVYVYIASCIHETVVCMIFHAYLCYLIFMDSFHSVHVGI